MRPDDPPNLDALLVSGRLDPDVQRARNAERNRRNSKAQGLALRALAKLYPDAYGDLYDQAVERVWDEAGPLPGDDDEEDRMARSRSCAETAA